MTLTATRARTHRLLIDTAMNMFNSGVFHSITEVAQEAQRSRATAYRYFPTQSTQVSAIVTETVRCCYTLNQEMSPQRVEHVTPSLSLVLGSEIFLGMKDIWGCANQQLEDIGKWIAKAIVRQAREDERAQKAG